MQKIIAPLLALEKVVAIKDFPANSRNESPYVRVKNPLKTAIADMKKNICEDNLWN